MLIPSQIQPIIHFNNQCPILFQKRLRGVIIGINDENIRHGFVTPLQTAVDIEIIGLRIVL